MHELGVVFHVMDSVKKVAENNKAKHIKSVTLQLGEVSTVIPNLLTDCWKWAVAKDEIMLNCELKIEGVRAITHCENCNKDYPTTVFEKVCPYCGSDKTYLIQGQEFIIKDIEVE